MASSPAGTIYRGREGMWSWVLHRITGVAIFFFLFVHVIDTAMVRVSPRRTTRRSRRTEPARRADGGRPGRRCALPRPQRDPDRLVDFWEKGPRYQRQLMYGVLGLWAVLFVSFVIRHLSNVFGS